MLEGKTSDDIMFKKVDKKTLKVPTDGVNDAINYFKSKNITETNDLIKAASVWVAEQIGLKKRDYREKANLDGNAELKEKKLRERETEREKRKDTLIYPLDYRKAYDLVSHSWVTQCMKLFGIAENLRTFLQKSKQ